MKKRFKNGLIFIIIIAMVLAMTACGGAYSSKPVGDSGMYNSAKYNGDKMELGIDNNNTEEYDLLPENDYKSVLDYPISTFSADVDTASYSNIRRFINDGQKVDVGAVRIEEMINYFKYDYPNPKNGEPLSITTELSDCPWNKDSKLMLIGLKTEDRCCKGWR